MANKWKLNKLYWQSTGLILLVVCSSRLLAATVNITADFTPDPTNPTANKFTNTSPVSGFCADYPATCTSANMFSFAAPLNLSTQVPIIAEHPDPRSGALFKVPADWQALQVRSSTGHEQTLNVRISGFGGRQRFSQDVSTLTGLSDVTLAHEALWHGSRWVYAPKPCVYTGVGGLTQREYRFFWQTPAASACGKTARFTIENLEFDALSIAYELATPNPLEMPSGTYTGTHTYSVGPNSDFDFGDNLLSSESVLTFNFTLTVNHILQVRFPPGADRLALIPKGGWQQWLNRGTVPEKLSADQNFQFWSSTAFNMQLQCQYPVADQCGIQNAAGHLVPVATSVTLPSGVVSDAATLVNRQRISITPTVFRPSAYVDNGRSTLHFEVDREGVEQMTGHAGSRYSGDVTVIWDSQT